jgi:hypothetical protein
MKLALNLKTSTVFSELFVSESTKYDERGYIMLMAQIAAGIAVASGLISLVAFFLQGSSNASATRQVVAILGGFLGLTIAGFGFLAIAQGLGLLPGNAPNPPTSYWVYIFGGGGLAVIIGFYILVLSRIKERRK